MKAVVISLPRARTRRERIAPAVRPNSICRSNFMDAIDSSELTEADMEAQIDTTIPPALGASASDAGRACVLALTRPRDQLRERGTRSDDRHIRGRCSPRPELPVVLSALEDCQSALIW